MSILNNSTNEKGAHQIKLIQSITKLVFASLVGVSLLFFSINTATANDTKSFDFPEKLTKKDLEALQSGNGKYQMTMSAVVVSNKVHWYTLVWNTQTGRSKIYYSNTKEGIGAGHSAYNLPSSPL